MHLRYSEQLIVHRDWNSSTRQNSTVISRVVNVISEIKKSRGKGDRHRNVCYLYMCIWMI